MPRRPRATCQDRVCSSAAPVFAWQPVAGCLGREPCLGACAALQGRLLSQLLSRSISRHVPRDVQLPGVGARPPSCRGGTPLTSRHVAPSVASFGAEGTRGSGRGRCCLAFSDMGVHSHPLQPPRPCPRHPYSVGRVAFPSDGEAGPKLVVGPVSVES